MCLCLVTESGNSTLRLLSGAFFGSDHSRPAALRAVQMYMSYECLTWNASLYSYTCYQKWNDN